MQLRSSVARMRWPCVLGFAAASFSCGAALAGAPKELYGKSVTVTWTESRETRTVGEETWRRVDGTETFNIYVSEAGRVFNRTSTANRGGSAEGKGEIAGQGGRSINFSGRSLLALFQMGRSSSAATRITADFDAGFGSCSAQVVRARETPGAIVRTYSGIIKHDIDIRSHQVGSVSCSVRTGNVFGQ
jgi:hypothetical protein